jgi:predicted metal-dependent hydrolase
VKEMKKQIRLFGKTFQYTFRLRRVRRRRIRRAASKSSRKNYLKYKKQARTLVLERLEFYKNIYTVGGYNFKVGRISIRNQKTRWGSCSKAGNLNFNYRIALLPPALADYVVVHELCHIGEFNHSRSFWNLVAVACPNYREIRNELKKKRFSLN